MNLDEIDDLDGLAARVEREQTRRQRQREKEQRRRRKRERAEKQLDRYFQMQSTADLRVLAEGGEPAVGPPSDLSPREQVERAEDALRERGETVTEPGEWFSSLRYEEVEILSHDHRSIDDARGCCPPGDWAALVGDSPMTSKPKLAEVAEEEIERRRRERQQAVADGGQQHRSLLMIAGIVALLVIVGGG